mmetsp:Transcript_52368/g.131563  ORF Transcript_52368/g.131563 Transcript_52368/m.131563 type:complete len:219 (-) Transcript_52368:221-877(-)
MGQVFGYNGVKEPAHDVLHIAATADVPYEIRRYATRFAAEVTHTGDVNSAFRALARYIGVFGQPENEGKTPIAMTAPVVKQEQQGTAISMTAPVVKWAGGSQEGEVMAFVLPAEFTDLAQIPKPTNPDIRIREVPAAVGAVYRYSGSQDTEVAREKARALARQLAADGLADLPADAPFEYWGYNPPFTLPFLRRNEVWIALDAAQAERLCAQDARAAA